jgi:hypothetical protein
MDQQKIKEQVKYQEIYVVAARVLAHMLEAAQR